MEILINPIKIFYSTRLLGKPKSKFKISTNYKAFRFVLTNNFKRLKKFILNKIGIFFKKRYKIKKNKKRKGDNVKNILKILFIFTILILSIILIIIFSNDVGEQNTSYAATASSSDIQLMARAINGEARGEPYEGQVAVGAVILNRVKSSQFPNTIAGVIYQSGAFTAVADGQINVPIAEGSSVYKAAKDAMNGWDPTGGCIYYFNPDTATNKWIWSRPYVKTIGKHRFCK